MTEFPIGKKNMYTVSLRDIIHVCKSLLVEPFNWWIEPHIVGISMAEFHCVCAICPQALPPQCWYSSSVEMVGTQPLMERLGVCNVP